MVGTLFGTQRASSRDSVTNVGWYKSPQIETLKEGGRICYFRGGRNVDLGFWSIPEFHTNRERG